LQHQLTIIFEEFQIYENVFTLKWVLSKTILSRIVDKYVENMINNIALGMLVKEVTKMKVIDDVNVVDMGFFFPTLALGMLEKEGGYRVTREKVIDDFSVTNGVLIKTCNCS